MFQIRPDMSVGLRPSSLSALHRMSSDIAGLLPRRKRSRLAMIAMAALGVGFSSSASAESLRDALERAYRSNPVFLAQQRAVPAAAAAIDRARAGYLPQVSGTAQIGYSRIESATAASSGTVTTKTRPRGVGIDVSQTLFDGGRTFNTVRQADNLLVAARESLRDTEQTVLLDAASAYVDVVRDTSILKLERQNHASLSEQLKLIRDLFSFGDVTQTDVLQVQARVSESRARVSSADAALRGSSAVYVQVIGSSPANLTLPRPQDGLVPARLEDALAQALERHPTVLAGFAATAAAEAQVRAAIGEYLPTVSVAGSLTQQYNSDILGDRRLNGSVVGRLTVPIFQGGETTARVREAREVALRRRIEVDAARAQVQAGVVRSWSQFQSARVRLAAAQEQVHAAALALKGVREEFGLGQRTATNVLDAVQDLLSASINLTLAQRERVITSYAVSRATGQLSLALIDSRVSGQPDQAVALFSELAAPPLPLRRQTKWALRPLQTDSPDGCPTDCVGQDSQDALLRPTL